MIDILMHYHSIATPHPRIESPAVQESVNYFVDHDVLKYTGEGPGYTVTEKGKAFIDMILETPFPEMKWIDPREEMK